MPQYKPKPEPYYKHKHTRERAINKITVPMSMEMMVMTGHEHETTYRGCRCARLARLPQQWDRVCTVCYSRCFLRWR